MTIKIIKDGRKPEDIPAQFGCNNCKAKLEATSKDAGRRQDDQRDGSYFIFTCPTCQHEIYVATSRFRTS